MAIPNKNNQGEKPFPSADDPEAGYFYDLYDVLLAAASSSPATDLTTDSTTDTVAATRQRQRTRTT